MFVTFYNHPVQTKIDEQGLPFYENKVFVIISRDHTNEVNRPADEDDFERFPETYAAFLKATSKEEKHEGLVLEMWALATPADILNLKAHGFHTVQQLAKVAKGKQAEMPPHIGVLVEQAKNYVKIAGDANLVTERINALTEEISMLKEDAKEYRRQLAAAQDQLRKNEAA